MAEVDPEQTSSKAATAASKVLQGKASRAARTAAGSALAQTRSSKEKQLSSSSGSRMSLPSRDPGPRNLNDAWALRDTEGEGSPPFVGVPTRAVIRVQGPTDAQGGGQVPKGEL